MVRKRDIRRAVNVTCVVVGSEGAEVPARVTLRVKQQRKRWFWSTAASRQVACFTFGERPQTTCLPVSVTAVVDLEHLYKVARKANAGSATVKVCVEYLRGGRRVARVGLNDFLGQLLRSGQPEWSFLNIYEEKVTIVQANHPLPEVVPEWLFDGAGKITEAGKESVQQDNDESKASEERTEKDNGESTPSGNRQHISKPAKSLAMAAVLAACAAVLTAMFGFMQPLDTAQHLQRSAEQVWQQEVQTRTTVIGRLRGALTALGVVDPAPDPLEECGVRLSQQPWWEAVWRVRQNSQQLACLEKHARLAGENHRQFKRRLAISLRMCLDVISAALLFAVAVHLVFDAPKPGTDTPCYGTLSGDVGVVPVREEAREDTGSATTAPSAGRAGEESPTGAGTRDELSWPPFHVPLTPQVSWTIYLYDSAVPAWFTPEDHQAVQDLVVWDAEDLKDQLLCGSITPAVMHKRLVDSVHEYLSMGE